jgi:hypothetical protein
MNVGIMADGTELVAMSISDRESFYGQKFEYVFYRKGMMPHFCKAHGETIEYIEKFSLHNYHVPRELQWSEIDI